jgi:hypothetical protein
VGILRAAIEIAVLAVLHPWKHLPLRRAITFQLVRDDHPGYVGQALFAAVGYATLCPPTDYCRVIERPIIDAGLPAALIVWHTDLDDPCTDTLSIIRGKSDMIDAPIAFASAFRPHLGGVRSYASAIRTRIAAASAGLLHWFILADTVYGNAHRALIGGSNAHDMNWDKGMIRRPQR